MEEEKEYEYERKQVDDERTRKRNSERVREWEFMGNSDVNFYSE